MVAGTANPSRLGLRARSRSARRLRHAADRLTRAADRLAPAFVAADRAEISRLLTEARPVTPLFQPVVALASGKIAGYEALARFPSHPDRPVATMFAQARRSQLGAALEAAAIRAALRATGGHAERSAAALGISRASLLRKIKSYGIERKSP